MPIHHTSAPRRAYLRFATSVAVLASAVIVGTSAPAAAAIDPLYEPSPPPPTWLAEWLADLQEVGGLTPDLVASREAYQWDASVADALNEAEEIGDGVDRWRALVALYFRPADVDWALRIVRCESGGDAEAKNKRSSASGLFQHLARLWPTRAARAGFGDRSVFDPEASVGVAAWLLYEGGGKSHWACKA